jgi:hypothetical protein
MDANHRLANGLLILAVGAGLTLGCGDDEPEKPAGGAGTTGETYAVAAEIETPEGDVLYLGTTPDLSAPFDLLEDGIELPNTSTFRFVGEQVFVAPNDAPTITRYLLDQHGVLQRDATLSFAGLGVTSARDYTIVSATKGYLYDFSTYTAHVFNPQTMTLNNVEIDFSAAHHEERGEIWLYPWRQNHILRDGTLFIPGGWWPEDGPEPRSLVLAFDTEADTVKVLEDDRCVNLSDAIQTENGDLYFFAQHYGLLVNAESIAPCALVIRAGETEFDPDYTLDQLAVLDGRTAMWAYQGPGNTAYLEVPYDERIPGDTLEETFYDAKNDKRLWKLDLETQEASEVGSVDFFNGIRFAFDLNDGRALMPVMWLNDPDDESAGYTVNFYELYQGREPALFEFGEASHAVRGRIAEIAHLR